MRFYANRISVFLLMALLLSVPLHATAARISDITNTKHNLSISGPGTVKANIENELCVFCHTPHSANITVQAPLWNRAISGATYEMYSSSSMESSVPAAPASSSKLCLSCHDGVLAVGSVNVLNGQFTDQVAESEDIAMSGTGLAGVMPDGSGASSGFTRNLGVNLTNDHPISFAYDSTLVLNDGELRDPLTTPAIGVRSSGVRPSIPLVVDHVDGAAKLECVSCHDPHIRDDSGEDIKFLRLNRFQTNAAPVNSDFNESNDIICLACHNKEGWTYSAHANELVADEVYTATAAAQRDFPNAIPVWRAACLNCHDTHTVQGSRRLLREGTDSTASPKLGGSSAIEESCYQCHSATGDTLTSQGVNTQVPDIKTDFLLARRMPITTSDQPGASEVHDIGTQGAGSGKDFLESPLLLGKGVLANRHVECTDCHNPHRVTKKQLANSDPSLPDSSGTHMHTAGTMHTNIASGVLRGAWGVEPVYTQTEFNSSPISFEIKKGLPGATMNVTDTWVSREYQVCLKCHSNYGFDDINPPQLGSFIGGTPSGTNSVTEYTNQAMEFQAPINHQGEGTALGTGAHSNYSANNHRSWHPVMGETGRDPVVRGGLDANIFLPPFNTGIGSQTMYCSDCHGSDTAPGTVVPNGGENGNPWGPHGSNNDFILKGGWDNETGTGRAGDLCFKCHNYNDYANPNNTNPQLSGFRGNGGGCMFSSGLVSRNLHTAHARRLGRMECTWCHVSVPHGWKNKALLVNLNDVGPEAGLPAGTSVSTPYTNGPYYNQSMLKVTNFAVSGSWVSSDCTSRMWMMMSCGNPP
ncbi:MAG: hypothetical protein L3J62_11265 [Gammaproteobacteria bacterium]|nr:hypothetical protein [Gammaproteobacteria bacterium]MCF6231340.1 hypothetical protein [Gammaproteobacteria bacterium]